DKKAALNIANQIRDSKLLPGSAAVPESEVHWRLSRVEWKAGKRDDALQTAEAIEDQGMRSRALVEVAIPQIDAGEIAAAKKACESLLLDWQKFSVKSALASALARNGDSKAAHDTYQDLLSMIVAGQDAKNPRFFGLLNLKHLVKELVLVG